MKSNEKVENAFPHVLPPLPYADNALSPVISGHTIGFHYSRHHKGYVDNLNKLIAGTEFVDLPLSTIITKTAGKADKSAIFNNAAQDWNHTFYWRSLQPNGGVNYPRLCCERSRLPSAIWMYARRSWRPRQPPSLEAAGRGSWRTATSSRWSRPAMRKRR